MAHKRIVTTAPIDRIAIDILEEAAPFETALSPDEETLMGLMEGTVGLVVRGEGKATARMIEAAADLAVIGRPGVGYDSVDLEAATARGIALVYAPIGGFAVAEGALALLLALVKKIPLCDKLVRDGQWNKRYDHATGDITGHTLGIIGLGRIGAHLARLVQPFGATLLGYDPFVDPEAMRDLEVELVELEELLGRSDFVSVHTPLNDETRGLLNVERIALMKPGAILINTSRGGTIASLDVLAEALEKGPLGAVGLDVFPTEPPDVSHRIFEDPRCLFAPHLVGVSSLAMSRMYKSMATDMVAVLKGERPVHCVNPEVFA